MSFNIWTESAIRSRWATRRDRIASILRWHQPDIIGLQEATHTMIQDLQERFAQLKWLGVGRDDGLHGGEFNPIFFNPERFDAVDHSTFWLAASGEKPVRGWDADCFRIVTWARFLEKKSGRTFLHCNTHFDHLGREARRESAKLLLKRISEIAPGEAAVVTGDFNCRESSVTYQILTGKSPGGNGGEPLRDGWYESQHPPYGPRKTWRGFIGGGFGSARIDYIFVKNHVRVLHYAVLADGENASDHLPVVAEIELME
jgi:endonuclease/exonuclease/phosphatase family metal-dependent hydrolase